MENLQSSDHYLIQSNPVVLQNIKEEIESKKNGLFILGEIKNFSFFKGYFPNEVVKTITQEIKNKIQEIFPNYICFKINEKYFAIIISNIAPEDSQEIVENIQRLVEVTKFTEYTIHVSAGFGVAAFPQDDNDPEGIFTKAYLAAKNIAIEDECYYLFFDEFAQQRELFIKSMEMADKLRTALNEQRIFLSFQPVVNSKNHEVVYHEALLRMKDIEGAEFSIGAYIEAAEKFRFINTIDELVLDLVVKELTKYSDINLSVNISAFAISNIAWMKKAQDLLKDRSVASRLIIEITETVAHKDFKKSIKFIEVLQDMGCKIALDDFGCGYTSFSQLKILPIDLVKIDGIFIKDIITNYNNEFFVKSVVELNKAINRIVVAEFVETKEIAEKLESLGVDELQGYFFGKPTSIPYWRSA